MLNKITNICTGGSYPDYDGIDMRHIQYQGETLPPALPPFPLVLAFHLVLGKFHIYDGMTRRRDIFASMLQLVNLISLPFPSLSG